MEASIPTNNEGEADLLSKARGFALRYRIILTPTDDGSFIANAMELPGIIIQEATLTKVVEELHNVLIEVIVRLLREGNAPPQPTAGRRLEQVNVKLSLEERSLMESAARARGNRGVADYLRQLGLEHISRIV